MSTQKIPVYCSQCVAGPDLIEVEVEDGVAKRITPNFRFHNEHPAGGRACVKAFGLIQKIYNPNRIKSPLRRTNPKKGPHEDPRWVEISWDEALELVAGRLRAIREKGLLDESGNPRLALTLGQGGIAPRYIGTFAAFMSAWGPLDQTIGAGQGVKCYHSEHIYGEFWHRAFIVVPDTPLCRYLISLGHNGNASAGVTGVWRHAEAKSRGLKRVQVEPHLSITGAFADEWVPIRPKTDAAFLYGLVHAILHEHDWRSVCDVEFLERRTNCPYLIGPEGYYLRDAESRKPLLWDLERQRAVPFDDPSLRKPALEGEFAVAGVEVGPDGQMWKHESVRAQPAFQRLLDHMRPYTPDWAGDVCDVPPARIRSVAAEYLSHACVGETITVEGKTYPYRPVSVVLGKTVTNGWGGYEACWGRTLLACLVGAVEVPGGIIGPAVRLNRPAHDRLLTTQPGPDGFMASALNPTDREHWQHPKVRSAYQTLVPLVGDGPWAAALGPAHLPWLFMEHTPRAWPKQRQPDVWIICRANPTISHWDLPLLTRILSETPFLVCFGYTPDETNWFADVILPESPDLESLQLTQVGGTQFVESYWHHIGWAIRQPVTQQPLYDTMDMTEVTTQLAKRVGILAEYNDAINNGRGIGISLKKYLPDSVLLPDRAYSVEDIWNRACKAATLQASGGKESHDLEWYKEHGAYFVPFPQQNWYLHTAMEAKGLRYEMPYQEQLMRVGLELGNRLHEMGVRWWDEQLAEYSPLPPWKPFPSLWDSVAQEAGKDPKDFPLWMVTTKSMQYAWGSTVSLPIMAEVAANVATQFGIVLNPNTARESGIKEGDQIWVESPLNRVKGKAVLKQGIRRDVILATHQFGHWITPFAKTLGMPNLNHLLNVSLKLTDASGSGADVVKVRIYKA